MRRCSGPWAGGTIHASMNVTAVLAIRNEEVYLANCLRHLVRNGVQFLIIDNESSDRSAEICRRREFAQGLVNLLELRFTGAFSLLRQLERKMEVISNLNTDWVIHIDADEVMHSTIDGESLNQAISRIDAAGWNAMNFEEFVFLPIDHDYVPDAPGYQLMVYYYFFQPTSPRLIRAWKKTSGFSMVEHGGHLLAGPDLRIAPENFVLRHYIFRSQEHAFRKYSTREFAMDELTRGWHGNRVNQRMESFRFPPAKSLRRLSDSAARIMDRSDPWDVHYWQRPANAEHADSGSCEPRL
jgi:glycosyltransferase involved in cell wall biosynthesis